ncbi:NADH:flavin oxidoreductase [Bacillus sp. HMF5848]|uniref:NAD(P)/FAD-dependent oxidoreductase n=1 Tax=Bacillus sp. HMF5848 TaxID=2495421 RepID=UPI000F775F26|nr:NAD(P)/FAD-dependent oxidoreductase [Bacillus sp. HMF5848]RSK25767.1 NADH:flavin oxidoreductase [Bacillus sp. HMF5848]
MTYTHLFSKGRIGTLQLKNRIVMPAIGTSLASSTGEASSELIAYYEERAKGGCGLIITEITRIDDELGVGCANQLAVTKPIHIPQLERLVRTVHKYDTKLFVQLHHPGRQTHSHLLDGKQIVAPSAIMCNRTKEMPRALTTEEVEGLIKKFVKGAKIAQMAGVDGVELHGAHGYLINQFLSPYTNKRADKYGGDFVNRARFITEIILGIKHICGKDFPVSVRLSGDEFVEGGLKLADTIKIAKYLESIGVDAINVSCGTYESGVTIVEPTSYPQGWKKHLAQGVKQAINIPVIAVSVIRKPEFAESLLTEGATDFVAVGRAQLADPEWSNKAFAGLDSSIRPCISCLHCIEELGKGGCIKCAVNPRMGRELEFSQLDTNGNDRTVAIIGGGPAGMEAARTLSMRGFRPVLFEKEGHLGGALRLAGMPPGKDKMTWFVDYLANELKEMNIDVRLNSEPSLEDIDALDPYAVFWAAGASPIIPNVPGINLPHVCTANDILDGKVTVTGKKAVIIGSGMTGCETAELLASQQNDVTIVEMKQSIGNGIYAPILYDISQKLKKYKVNVVTGHSLAAINDTTVSVASVSTRTPLTMEADIVVLSMGVRPRQLLQDIEDRYSRVKVIGDAGAVGRIAEAVREGYEKAYVLA